MILTNIGDFIYMINQSINSLALKVKQNDLYIWFLRRCKLKIAIMYEQAMKWTIFCMT